MPRRHAVAPPGGRGGRAQAREHPRRRGQHALFTLPDAAPGIHHRRLRSALPAACTRTTSASPSSSPSRPAYAASSTSPAPATYRCTSSWRRAAPAAFRCRSRSYGCVRGRLGFPEHPAGRHRLPQVRVYRRRPPFPAGHGLLPRPTAFPRLSPSMASDGGRATGSAAPAPAARKCQSAPRTRVACPRLAVAVPLTACLVFLAGTVVLGLSLVIAAGAGACSSTGQQRVASGGNHDSGARRAGSAGSAGDGGFVIDSGNPDGTNGDAAQGFDVQPAAQQTHHRHARPDRRRRVKYTATLDGKPVNVAWTVDRGALGSVAPGTARRAPSRRLARPVDWCM